MNTSSCAGIMLDAFSYLFCWHNWRVSRQAAQAEIRNYNFSHNTVGFREMTFDADTQTICGRRTGNYTLINIWSGLRKIFISNQLQEIQYMADAGKALHSFYLVLY